MMKRIQVQSLPQNRFLRHISLTSFSIPPAEALGIDYTLYYVGDKQVVPKEAAGFSETSTEEKTEEKRRKQEREGAEGDQSDIQKSKKVKFDLF